MMNILLLKDLQNQWSFCCSKDQDIHNKIQIYGTHGINCQLKMHPEHNCYESRLFVKQLNETKAKIKKQNDIKRNNTISKT